MKFCKVFNIGDSQLLVEKKYSHEFESFVLSFKTENNQQVLISHEFGYETEELRDKNYDDFDEKEAIEMKSYLNTLI